MSGELLVNFANSGLAVAYLNYLQNTARQSIFSLGQGVLDQLPLDNAMTIYIENNQYFGEIKRQLMIVACPNSSALRPQFIAPAPLPNVHKVDVNQFSKVVYSTPIGSIEPDFGAIMINELANHQDVVYIHGVSGDYRVPSEAPVSGRNARRSTAVADQGGGSTTPVFHASNVHVFLDATAANNTYKIDSDQGVKNALPYIRMYHELVHAAGLILKCFHGHGSSIPQTNRFRSQRDVGYQRI